MITISLDVLEMFLYYWQATSEKEKVSDLYLTDIAERHEMAVLLGEDFSRESIRKVLSSITNREVLSSKTKAEGRFWNNNMWMLEDLGLTAAMLAPVKQLKGEDLGEGDLRIIFIPGHLETLYRRPGELYVNFFKLSMDFADGSVKIEDKPLQEFLKEAIGESR